MKKTSLIVTVASSALVAALCVGCASTKAEQKEEAAPAAATEEAPAADGATQGEAAAPSEG